MQYRPGNMSDLQMLSWLQTQYDTDEKGCWIWRKHKCSRGYGSVRWKGKDEKVHRLYWLLSGRTIPEGEYLCHAPNICHNTSCYNPEHLRADTQSNNALDRHLDGTMRQAKLTADEVREIRADTRAIKIIAEHYKVSRVQIERIKSGQRWAWLI